MLDAGIEIAPRCVARYDDGGFLGILVVGCCGFECEGDPLNVRQCGQGTNACGSLVVFEVNPKRAGVIYEQW